MSNTIKQGEAVFQAVCATLGEISGKVTLTKEQSKEVANRVIAMFLSGQTVHSKGATPEQLAKYVPGLVNNWVRKDPRLNGNTKYVTKNPGSRAGSGDASMKAMKQLLAATTDEKARQEIEKEIAARASELKPKAAINVDALPEALRHLVG